MPNGYIFVKYDLSDFMISRCSCDVLLLLDIMEAFSNILLTYYWVWACDNYPHGICTLSSSQHFVSQGEQQAAGRTRRWPFDIASTAGKLHLPELLTCMMKRWILWDNDARLFSVGIIGCFDRGFSNSWMISESVL